MSAMWPVWIVVRVATVRSVRVPIGMTTMRSVVVARLRIAAHAVAVVWLGTSLLSLFLSLALVLFLLLLHLLFALLLFLLGALFALFVPVEFV